jgi:hypothetical protein
MKNRRIVYTILGILLVFTRASEARWLNANSGRFQTMDSFEGNLQDPPTLHRYTYCSGDPVNGTDPTGLWREISSNFQAGKDAEKPVVDNFLSQRPFGGKTLLSIHGILNYASNTGYKGLGRLVPDLVDDRRFEIYDVKSWNETPAGMIKVQAYAIAFSQADPNSATATKWHAGTTYNYSGSNPYQMPGKSNGKDVWAVYFNTQAV